MANTEHPTSILVLGATGRTGLACIRKLCRSGKTPQVYAFCRKASKLPRHEKALCAAVIEGDARSPSDIEWALTQSKADVVIVAIGNGDSVAKTDIRTVSALSLSSVMKKDKFNHVQAVVISSSGAGSSKIIVGFGVGTIISFHLRHVLKDHTRQELAFGDIESRTFIVRATALSDQKATGKLAIFGDKDRAPSIETDRGDLAAWITQEIFAKKKIGGRIINVTGVKK